MNFKNHIKLYLTKYFYQNKLITIPDEDQLSIWKSKNYTPSENNITKLPKIIWSFWDSEVLPETIKLCFNSWQKLHPDYEIRILNNNTIKDYIPDFPELNKDIIPPLKCDLIRLYLLKNQGGIYLDAGVFLNDSLDKYIALFLNNQLDVLTFSVDDHPNDKNFPITESWFIISKPNNEYIEKWRFYMEECYTSKDFEAYFRDHDVRKFAYYSINEAKRDYLFIYMAAQMAIKTVENSKIGLLDSMKNGFFYNYYFKFNYEKIAKFLLLQTKFSRFPSIIKLIAKNRIPIEKMIKNKCYRKNSLFGKYINN